MYRRRAKPDYSVERNKVRNRKSCFELVVNASRPSCCWSQHNRDEREEASIAHTRQTTAKANQQVNQEDDDKNKQSHQLDILPPHPSLKASASNTEVVSRATQAVSLVNQKVDSLASF